MKKLFQKSGLGIIALVIASSCAKDDVFVQNNDDAVNFNESPYAVSEMEAKEVLASFMNQFDSNLSGDVSTKSGSIRTIKDVQTLGPNDNGGTKNYKFVNENEYAILNY